MDYAKMLKEGKTKRYYVHPALQVFVAAVIVIACTFTGTNVVQADREARSCAGLRAQGLDPQKLLDGNYSKYTRLDHNHNGLACEK